MNGAARDPELDALLGAYALDALDDDERAAVDAYVASNPAARNEVDELRETAAAIALTPVEDTSGSREVWDRIEASIAKTPRNVTPIAAAPSARRRPWTTLLVVAASVAIVVLAASVIVVGNRSSSSKAGDVAAGYEHARKQPGARELTLTAPGGGIALARAVVLPDGTGYLQNEAMKPLPNGRTYQLWQISSDPALPPVSAGVLGADPRAVAFHTDPNVRSLGLTNEQASGSVSPTQPMVAISSVA